MTIRDLYYPLFVPPSDLACKPRRQWNVREAKAYRQWLLDISDHRLAYLCELSGLSASGDPREVLEAFGGFAAQNLKGETYNSERGSVSKLTNEDYALCADIGILFAKKLLQARCDSVGWVFFRKPRSAMSYNLPVISGFKDGTYVDPIGGAVSEGRGVLTGGKTHHIWREMFDFWCAKD